MSILNIISFCLTLFTFIFSLIKPSYFQKMKDYIFKNKIYYVPEIYIIDENEKNKDYLLNEIELKKVSEEKQNFYQIFNFIVIENQKLSDYMNKKNIELRLYLTFGDNNRTVVFYTENGDYYKDYLSLKSGTFKSKSIKKFNLLFPVPDEDKPLTVFEVRFEFKIYKDNENNKEIKDNENNEEIKKLKFRYTPMIKFRGFPGFDKIICRYNN